MKTKRKRNYVQIDNEKRKIFIELVVSSQRSTKQVNSYFYIINKTNIYVLKKIANEVGINYPIAKVIMKIFRQEGRIEKKPKKNFTNQVILMFL